MTNNSDMIARISAQCAEAAATAEALQVQLAAQPDDKIEQILGDQLAALSKLEAARDGLIEDSAREKQARSDLFAGGKDV